MKLQILTLDSTCLEAEFPYAKFNATAMRQFAKSPSKDSIPGWAGKAERRSYYELIPEMGLVLTMYSR